MTETELENIALANLFGDRNLKTRVLHTGVTKVFIKES